MPRLEPGLRAWSSFRDYAYDDPGRVKLNHWHVAALKRIAMRKRELPRPCKKRKSGAPPCAVVDSQRMPEAGPPSPATRPELPVE